MIKILALLLLLPSLAWAGPEMLMMLTNGMGTVSAGGGWVYEDDFSTNTMSPFPGTYSALTAGTPPTVGSGVLESSGTYAMQYSGTGANVGAAQVVQAKVYGGATNTVGRLMIRSDNNGTSSKYHTCGRDLTLSNHYVNCLAVGGGSGTNFTLAFTGDTWETGAYRNVKITVTSGGLHSLYIDWNNDGDFEDAGETEGTATNNTMTGTYGGIGFTYGGSNIDNFKIGTLP